MSNDDLQVDEGFVYIVMISSKDFVSSRQYAYHLLNEMLDFELEKPSWVKCHLVVADIESSVIRKLGSVKEEFFRLTRKDPCPTTQRS